MNHLISPKNKTYSEHHNESLKATPVAFSIMQELWRNADLLAAIISLLLAMSILEAATHSILTSIPGSRQSPMPHRHDQEHMSPLPSPTQCGSSPSQAQNQGCLFDLLSFAWQPPACYDNRTIAEFMAFPSRPWEFFTDEADTAPIAPEDLSLNREEPVRVRWEFHVVHCMYMRRQMVRAVLDGRPLDSHVARYEHTVHCGKTILDGETPLENLHTGAPVIYPECKALRDWVGSK